MPTQPRSNKFSQQRMQKIFLKSTEKYVFSSFIFYISLLPFVPLLPRTHQFHSSTLKRMWINNRHIQYWEFFVIRLFSVYLFSLFLLLVLFSFYTLPFCLFHFIQFSYLLSSLCSSPLALSLSIIDLVYNKCCHKFTISFNNFISI